MTDDEEVSSEAEAPPMLESSSEESESDMLVDVVVTSVEKAEEERVEIDLQDGRFQQALETAKKKGLSAWEAELVVSKDSRSYTIRRSVAELEALLVSWAQMETDMDDKVVQVPEFPVNKSDDDVAMAQWCTDMSNYLAGQAEVMRYHTDWKTFIDEHDTRDRRRSDMTAIEFILQPFSSEKTYISRASEHDVTVDVQQAGQFVIWKFEVEGYDIDFSVLFYPKKTDTSVSEEIDEAKAQEDNDSTYDYEEIVVQSKRKCIPSDHDPSFQGMFKAPGSGTIQLRWDNTYSRIRGKSIVYQVQVVDRDIMTSASAAAAAYAEAEEASKFTGEAFDTVSHSPTDLTLSNEQDAASLLSFQNYLPSVVNDWIMAPPINAAGSLLPYLFGSQSTLPDEEQLPSDALPDENQAKSLLEELNGLNMQLLERVEELQDGLHAATKERDDAMDKVHALEAEKEAMAASLQSKTLELSNVQGDIDRMQREREAWGAIQEERDQLLEEKHRWEMQDAWENEDDTPRTDLEAGKKEELENELSQAEASVLRLRAELGYPLANRLTGTSTRLEKIAKEMAEAKKRYEDETQERNQLQQALLKYRSQKKVLVAEIKNMKSQTESQVAAAAAEANEARMVNRRLKRQNELLLSQIRNLVDDSTPPERPPKSEDKEGVAYTLNADDIALLNGKPRAKENPYRRRLVAYLQEKDPAELPRVEEMLESYAGVEDALFESLELKYSFSALHAST